MKGGKGGGWRILTSVALFTGSYLATWYMDYKKAKREFLLKRYDERIEKLYGPLYGRCVVLKSSYHSAIGRCSGISEYLRKAQETKDAEAIWRWRSFVWNNLRPVEKKIVDLISENSHLIVDEFPSEFDVFLKNHSKFEFTIQRWKNKKGEVEDTIDYDDEDFLEQFNAPKDINYDELFDHIKGKCEELRKCRTQEMVEYQANIE